MEQFVELFQDLLAALATVMNGIPQGLLALSYGFASVPMSLGFFVGAAACGMLGSVAPISFQAESIVLAGQVGSDKKERISMIIWAAVITILLGVFGVMGWAVEFSGPIILNAMMAGVGIMLTRTALDMGKKNLTVTAVSVTTALLLYFFITKELLWIVVISMLVSSAVSYFMKKDNEDVIPAEKPFKMSLVKPGFNLKIFRGALAMACMTIGGNIAYGSVTASIAGGANQLNVDGLTVYSGIADLASSLFGGMSLEAIISATASAPNPVRAAVLMQLIMGLILIFGLLPKLAKFIPSESISGFLFVLGAFITIPGNAQVAFSGTDPGSSVIAAVTMAVTAVVDPFVGITAGLVIRFLFGLGFGI